MDMTNLVLCCTSKSQVLKKKKTPNLYLRKIKPGMMESVKGKKNK